MSKEVSSENIGPNIPSAGYGEAHTLEIPREVLRRFRHDFDCLLGFASKVLKIPKEKITVSDLTSPIKKEG